MNYTPTTIPGDVRRRSFASTVNSPDGELPSVTWYEEDRINRLDGGVSYEKSGSLISTFFPSQLEEEIPIIDPDTGDILGATTRGRIAIIVTSLYIHDAKKRDNGDPLPPEASERP